eukprot:CAMPEP_0205930350 /NCGR_PEP_ID=MMETSP1325-20131115/25837_1 /ASSEMBLY_ACC=CAM_ASM_000708 /TAXON_ID=236786 /ORGANISM="Florenciella sp., Strain RCC1007" /LENGTH=55 /DNA_ID=CAMNT_0053299705 /DNA_START=112 /DNA_END=275 /DNA_ORIENTATION=+
MASCTGVLRPEEEEEEDDDDDDVDAAVLLALLASFVETFDFVSFVDSFSPLLALP